MAYIVKTGDQLVGPFSSAGEAAEWAIKMLAPSYIRQGLWSILELRKP